MNSDSYYKKIIRPIRLILTKLLFRLLRVDSLLADIVLIEDVKMLEGTQPLEQVVPEMTARFQYALATCYLCPNYREVLYYQLAKFQRANIKTVDPMKRDIQHAGSLFILRHLQEMKEAYNTLHRRGQLPERKIKEVLRSFHNRQR